MSAPAMLALTHLSMQASSSPQGSRHSMKAWQAWLFLQAAYSLQQALKRHRLHSFIAVYDVHIGPGG
jgi:hypothetical protein